MASVTSTSKRSLDLTHPEEARYWDVERNLTDFNLDITHVTAGSNKKAWFSYPECGHTRVIRICLQVSIPIRTCRPCSQIKKKRVSSKFVALRISEPEVVAHWLTEENATIGLSLDVVSRHSLKHAWFSYPDCSHKAFIKISDRVRKRDSCLECRSLAGTHPEIASYWNIEKNRTELSLEVNSVSSGSGQKAWFGYPGCSHILLVVIQNRVNGGNCGICTGKAIISGINDLATTHPTLASRWLTEKNRPLGITMENTSHAGRSKAWFSYPTCKHIAFVAIRSITQGSGCRRCMGRISKIETSLFDELLKDYPNAIQQYRLPDVIYSKGSKITVDIYIPELRLIVEYDGVYWHSTTAAYSKDHNKTLAMLTQQYSVIRIRDYTKYTTLSFLNINDPKLVQVPFMYSLEPDDIFSLAQNISYTIQQMIGHVS